jgi:hypothetical protein
MPARVNCLTFQTSRGYEAGEGKVCCRPVSEGGKQYLKRTNCRSFVEIERKILIENHGDIPGTGFHL